MKRTVVAAVAIVVVAGFVGLLELRHHRQARVASNRASTIRPALGGAPVAGGSDRLLSKFAEIPLSFEENRGQFDPHVKFATRGADYGLFLSGAQATIVHHGRAHIDAGDVSSAIATLGNSELHTRSVTQLTWLGANAKARPRGVSPQSGESNYFIGKDPRKWRRHVRHYDRVELTGLYPGIDLIYHGAQKRVEFDYVIAPHVDPSEIQVGISGPSIVALGATGQLSISGSGDKMTLLPPAAYQEKDGKREIVEAHYVLADSHKFGFHLGAYDASRPVIIDPVLEFAASFGPNVNDTIVTDVVLDSTGNIYLTGTTCETDYPTTSGVFQPQGGSITSDDCNDAIITKLDPTASSLLYSTYVGGQSGVDFGVRLLVDSAGEATVVGTTASTDFPTTSGVYQSAAKGGDCVYGPNVTPYIPCTDAFLLKLSADGSSLEYSTYFGGERAEFAIALTQDSAGDSYIAGSTDSTALPLGGSPYQDTYGGGSNCQGNTTPCFDGFIAKFNPTGTQLLASTYLGGNQDDMIAALALDSSGNVYATGVADSANFPTTPGAIQTVHAGAAQGDAFLSKLDPTLHTLQYSTFLGGTGDDIAFGLRVDSTGAAYITGSTLSSDFPTTTGAYQTVYNGPDPATTTCIMSLEPEILMQPTCGDVFVSKINPSQPSGSQLVFSTYLGGSGNNFAYNLALDSQNNVWVVGDTNSTNYPYTSAAYFAPTSGSLFLSEIKSDGSQLLYSTGLAAGGGGLALGISIDSTNDVFVAGQGTVSATAGTYSFGQPGQVFVTEYSSGTAQPGVGLSATSLAFSNTPTNSASAPQPVTLTNTGTASLQLVVSVGSSNVFSETDNCGTTVAAGATCTINVTYLPTAPTTITGNPDQGQVLVLDNAPGAPHVVSLSGTNGLTTSASFLPATLSFPGQQPGVASASQMSGISSQSETGANIGAVITALPVLSGPNASEFAVDESQCASLNSGCLVTVTFTPAVSATGTRTATLTVPTTAPNSPQKLALTGTVAPGPFAVLSPSPVAMNAVTVGQASPIQTLFVHNTGGGTLNVTGFNITGANASEFAISAGDCGPALTLAPQASCFVNLTFTPAAPGNRTATITLADNETTPASTTVTGTGATAGGPQIDVGIIGSTTFSDTTVGQNTASTPIPVVTVTNVGTGAGASAHVTAITLTGDFQTQPAVSGGACVPPFLLPGNQSSCTVNVLFAPTAVGLRTGTLTIQTDAPGTPSFSFNFAGNGILTAGVSLIPTTLNFGKEVLGGTTGAQTVTLKNTGGGVLNLSSLAISGPFSQTTTCGVSLAAGASCTFSVQFSPTASGSGTGALTFNGSAAGGVYAVGLSGIGATGPAPQAVPASLTFGNQPINTVSAAQAVTLSNAGDTAFSFLGVRASENFSATSNCPSSISPGASCTINVTFAPTDDVNPGFGNGGSVFVTTSASGSPLAIPTLGTATAPTGAPDLPSISSSPNPSTLGQPVTFTATITSTTPGTPTGTVVFLDNGNPLGAAVPVNAQAIATFTTSTLGQGNHSIFCIYSGDATYVPATSSGIGQTVNAVAGTKAATTTILASSLNPSTTGASVTFTATVSSTTAGTITGTVTFLDGTTSLGTGTLAGGVATFMTSSLAAGPHSVTAQYGGDPNYAASTSAVVTQTVNAGADFSVAANPTALTIVAGQTGSVALTVTPQNGSTQTVTFSCSSLPSASACAFVPVSVTLDGTHAASTQVTVSTTARKAAVTAAGAARPPMLGRMLGLFAICLAGILGLSLLPRRTTTWRIVWAMLILSIPMALLIACGSGSSSTGEGGGTPAGTSQISITATSGADSHAVVVALTVQ
jgi:hypothetical protein